MTYSHPWGSAPGSQIIRSLFGIQPTKAGYSEFQVKLHQKVWNMLLLKFQPLKAAYKHP